MAEPKRIYQKNGLRDYSIYLLTTVLKTGERLYFDNIISGQVKPSHSVVGDGVKTISALTFEERVFVSTSGNVDLSDFRIEGNSFEVYALSNITVNIGTGGTPVNLPVPINVSVLFIFLNGNWIADFKNADPPIGTVMAWHKSLTGTPTLPANWVECNGQVLSDTDSLYDGQTIPDLNGDELFLRGGAASGIMQIDAIQDHVHFSGLGTDGVPRASDSGIYASLVTGDTAGAATARMTPGSTAFDASAPNSQWVNSKPKSDGVIDTPRTADETRPVNMSVVWIIKIK